MKIRSKLILAFLFIALSLVILTNGLFYVSAKKNLTRQILNQLESVASIQHNRLHGIVAQNLERWGLVASRTQLCIILEQFTRDSSREQQARMNAILHDAMGPISDFKNISLFALDGTVIASTDAEKIGENHADAVFFVRGQQKISVDHFFFDKDQRLMVTFSGPLYLLNKLTGVLVIECVVENIANSIGDYTGLGKTGETILATRDENGDALFLMPTRFDKQAALQLVIPKQEVDKPITQIFAASRCWPPPALWKKPTGVLWLRSTGMRPLPRYDRCAICWCWLLSPPSFLSFWSRCILPEVSPCR